MGAPKARKTAFVPRVVFSAAVAGVAVVPMCVIACGGQIDSGTLGVAATFTDSGADSGIPIVALAFDGGGVAVSFADSGDANRFPDVGFTVACQCFDGGIGVAKDAFFIEDVAVSAFGDSGPDGSPPDAFVGVGVSAFGDGGDAEPPRDTGVPVDAPEVDAFAFTVAKTAFEAGN